MTKIICDYCGRKVKDVFFKEALCDKCYKKKTYPRAKEFIRELEGIVPKEKESGTGSGLNAGWNECIYQIKKNIKILESEKV